VGANGIWLRSTSKGFTALTNSSRGTQYSGTTKGINLDIASLVYQVEPSHLKMLHLSTRLLYFMFKAKKSTIFWDVTPRIMVEIHYIFEINYCIRLQYQIVRKFKSKTLLKTVNAPRYLPNTVIRRDLQTPTVKEEIRRYSCQYSAHLSAQTKGLVVNLMEQPNNRRLRRHLPNDLPTTFLV
jgi:hypothetical protein